MNKSSPLTNGSRKGKDTNDSRKGKDLKPIIGHFGVWVILTYLSVVSAIVGVHFALDGNIRYALIFLMLAGLCDTFDGAVASMSKRTDDEKNYGIQIDALADIISFGIFPIIIGYAVNFINATQELNFFQTILHVMITSIYVLSALIRLAYFNVVETKFQNTHEKRMYYEGLPVTSVALIIPMIYSVCTHFDIPFSAIYNISLTLLAIVFVLRIKIPKPRGCLLILVCLLGVPILVYLFLSGGM